MAFHHIILEKSKAYIQEFNRFLEDKKKQKQKSHVPAEVFPEESSSEVVFSFSLSSALKIILVLLALFLAFKIIVFTSDILILLFFAVFLAATLTPPIRFLERHKIPRPFAILLVFITLIGFLAFLFSTILPALVSQGISLGEWIMNNVKAIYAGDFSVLPSFLQSYGGDLQQMIQKLDVYVQSLQTSRETQRGFLQMLSDNIGQIASWKDGITSVVSAITAFLGQMLLVFVMVFFILLDRESIRDFLLSFFPFSLQKYIYIKSHQVQGKIAEWVHGQMILFLFMGVTTWVFLSFMGVEYSLAIGFISGIAEFLPFIGPPITLLIALPLAFGQGVDIGIYTIIFFACQQFIEGNILVPLVMEKAVGVTPIVTIIAMLVGFQFLGILGAIMAIPMASIIGIFLQDFRTPKVYSEKNYEDNAYS